jgi:DNA-binding NtrC family response regulator
MEDIIPLTDYFLEKYCGEFKIEKEFSNDAKAVLLSYDWPGNVRELQHLIERLLILTDTRIISAEDVLSDLYYDDMQYSFEFTPDDGPLSSAIKMVEYQMLK